MQGKLIVFEGVEGSGKSTQLQRCLDWLQASGIPSSVGVLDEQTPVVVTREPGGTSLGLGLRKLLLEEHSSLIQDRAELLLYAADRAQPVEEFLHPQLALRPLL